MRKQKEIKLIVHHPKEENIPKLNLTLSTEYARLIKALLFDTPKEK